MVGWHHQLDGREFEQAPGVGDRQGSLVSCSPWGRKESDKTEGLNKNNDEQDSPSTVPIQCLRIEGVNVLTGKRIETQSVWWSEKECFHEASLGNTSDRRTSWGRRNFPLHSRFF